MPSFHSEKTVLKRNETYRFFGNHPLAPRAASTRTRLLESLHGGSGWRDHISHRLRQNTHQDGIQLLRFGRTAIQFPICRDARFQPALCTNSELFPESAT